MNKNEKAVWSALYSPCNACFMDFDEWKGWNVRQVAAKFPPLPTELVGWVTNSPFDTCDYCDRVYGYVVRGEHIPKSPVLLPRIPTIE